MCRNKTRINSKGANSAYKDCKHRSSCFKEAEGHFSLDGFHSRPSHHVRGNNSLALEVT